MVIRAFAGAPAYPPMRAGPMYHELLMQLLPHSARDLK
jgi:hypothetical protein